ncbi:hypothetical protein F4808DRAFT_475476 [Astrocystis sublimbata]|nr:hypothetical protein F4808DRAFT_475476 [Astrocystis sublimbata]
MLTPAIINIQSFFYPVGNTPAISLTQSIPPGDPADILLLGCGDVRNILFTVHNDSRKLDVTCCDNQKAVIARNVLLLSLIIDHEDGQNDKFLWNIYYHLYLGPKALDLLRSQSKTLYELSSTMDTWQQGKYGRCLSFCDDGTLADVRKMWEYYSVERKGAEATRFQSHFKAVVDRARTKGGNRSDPNSVATNLSTFRSAAPAHIRCLQDISDLDRHFWKYGTTELKAKTRSAATHPNPAFLTLGDGANLHYGTDPLHGFHLATVDTPLDSTDAAITQLPRLEKYAALARAEFRGWMASYREQVHKNGIKVRFFVGDAVSFAHTLQHKHMTSKNTAYWYRDRFGVRPLVLDGPDYALGAQAPVQFDVIDTSNLCDHLGSLTLLTATSPLLRDDSSAVLYNEVLAGNHKSPREVLDQVLCGDVPTLSALLGLFPVEYWTNTSCTSIGDEKLRDACMVAATNDPKARESGQMYLRTSWKRAFRMNPTTTPLPRSIPIRFDPEMLARTLYSVYCRMFLDENWAYKLSNMSLGNIAQSALVWYHRASFASFLQLVQNQVTCNWNEVMKGTMDLIEERPNAPMGMNYYQELNGYLHLFGVYSTFSMEKWSRRDDYPMLTPYLPRIRPANGLWGDIRDWKNMPALVCVTLKIPREKLAVFTEMSTDKLGTPAVHCQLQGSDFTWQNLFPACQLSFGRIHTSGEIYDDSYEVLVQEDDAGWNGTSGLIASFFAPAWQLYQDPQDVAVAFGVHSTPISTFHFKPKLGMSMQVYETTLDNTDAVYVTRFAPNQKGCPMVSGPSQVTPTSGTEEGADFSLIATVDGKTGNMTTLTGRLDITSSVLKEALTSDCEVTKSTVSPCEVSISLGDNPPLGLHFPVFIKETSQKVKVARKSSYVEVIVQVAQCSEWVAYPYSMYPIQSLSGKPVNYNIPYINLKKCLAIQTADPSKLGWLTTHLSLSMSSRERALREKDDLPRSFGEQVRLRFKEALFAIFVQYTGLQGNKNRVFALHNAGNGGVHVVILVSALRLDLANRGVVLDCAVLPLQDALMLNIMEPLGKLQDHGFTTIPVKDADLRLWRHVLPAYVERCRDWAHRDNCEYATSGSIPLHAANGMPVLCTCGNGKFPPSFISNIPGWHKLSKYAVHAAISPAWWAPFADGMYSPNLSDLSNPGEVETAGVDKAPGEGGCASCGREKQANGRDLLDCSRCKKVKYCSHECQKRAWKKHKHLCK